jgi:hypothetical protein
MNFGYRDWGTETMYNSSFRVDSKRLVRFGKAGGAERASANCDRCRTSPSHLHTTEHISMLNERISCMGASKRSSDAYNALKDT